MIKENKKIPFYLKGEHFEIHGPPLPISKDKFIKVLKSLIPKTVQYGIHNKFAEQTKQQIIAKDSSSFNIIHIETRTLCNGRCAFCPAAVQYKSRPDHYMPSELYSKIIEQLQMSRYRGRISPYCNNEPLIDERTYDFLKETRKKCPQAYLEIKTNGKVLDIEKLQLLIDLGLDEINIADYANTNDFSGNIQEIIQAIFDNKLDFKESKVIITWRKEKEVLQNRAGKSPTPPSTPVPLNRFCSRPFEMITVGTEGQIGVCSSDFNFQHILGNINEISLLEAWNCREYQRLRESMLRRDRTCTVPCSKCDYHSYYSNDLKGLYRWIRWI